MITNKLKSAKANKRLNSGIRLVSTTFVGCFLVGSAFMFGSSTAKPEVVHFDNAQQKVAAAYYNAGVEAGSNSASSDIREGKTFPFETRSLKGAAAASFVKGYVKGYYDQQTNAAEAGMIYGVCLQMNHIERVDAFHDDHKQTVALPVKDLLDEDIILTDAFAKGVRQSYEISNWTYTDIRWGIDHRSQKCDLSETAEKVSAWATEVNSSFAEKGSKVGDLDKFVNNHFPEEAKAAVKSAALGATPHNNWQMSYIDGDQPLL